jgi:hypothetical protein
MRGNIAGRGGGRNERRRVVLPAEREFRRGEVYRVYREYWEYRELLAVGLLRNKCLLGMSRGRSSRFSQYSR